MSAPTKPRQRGRPVSPDARRDQVQIRATPEEIAAWRAAAERAGHDLSTWLRALADRASGRR